MKSDRLVRSLALAIFLQWLGASAILPLLPIYLRHHGGSDGIVGAVMGSYFAAALILQYPAGRLADRIGRRPVLVGGLLVYAVGSLGFIAPIGPAADIAMRSMQGAGAGAAEVAALALISGTVELSQRGRAFGAIYSGQVGGMAIGPLLGSLIGVGAMNIIFVAAALGALAACLPVLTSPAISAISAATRSTGHQTAGRLTANPALVGSLLTAGALGLIIGVYESCWTLLLHLRHAHDWQIGLSWTLFATPFVAMSRVGGWLADHLDRRWLVVGSLLSSIGFCTSYPFIHSIPALLILGAVEALGMAIALPSAQSLLTQASRSTEVGRVQGLFSTSQTAAIAVSAGSGGALFAVAPWAPFLAGAGGALVLTILLPLTWRRVTGRVAHHVASGSAAVPEVLESTVVLPKI